MTYMTVFIRLIATALVSLFLANPTIAFAQDDNSDGVVEHNCGNCDTTSPIDLNYEVRVHINQNVSQWHPGDVIKLTNNAGQTTTWTYTGGGSFVRGATTNPGGGPTSSGSGWGGASAVGNEVWGNYMFDTFGIDINAGCFDLFNCESDIF